MYDHVRGRPFGRLLLFVLLPLLLCGTGTGAAVQGRTVVQDFIYRADGTPASGTLLISWPSFRSANNQYVGAGSKSIELAPDGSFSVELVPTDGSDPEVRYRVVMHLVGSPVQVQYWAVPATPTSGIVVQPPPAGGADPVSPPYVPQYVLKQGDFMSGPLTLSRDPELDEEAATKHYVDTKIEALGSSRSVKDFGAVCDGSGTVDDTAAFQAALDSFHHDGGILRIPHGCRVTPPLTFSNTKTLVLELEGSLYLNETLTLPANVNLIGKSGGGGVQFQVGPTARLEQWGSQSPVLRLLANNYVSNIEIPWGVDGLKLDGTATQLPGALVRLENIGISVSGTPLIIDEFFWVWTRDCRFLPSTTNGYSIYITNTDNKISSSGLLYFRDTILSMKGVKIDTQVPVSNVGAVHFDGLLRENSVGPLLTLDATISSIQDVTLSNVGDADPIDPGALVHVIAPVYRVMNLRIDNSQPAAGFPFVSGDTHMVDLTIDQPNDPRLGLFAAPVGQRFRSMRIQTTEVNDLDWLGTETTALPLHSVRAYELSQDLSTWTDLATATVEPGTIAPDGSNTAYTLRSASGPAGRQKQHVLTYGVGDWIIAGVWLKAANGHAEYPNLAFNVSDRLDNASYILPLVPRGFTHGGWQFAINVAKVVSVNVGQGMNFTLPTDSAKPVAYWKPFLIHIPAGSMSDAEVMRLARFGLRNVVPGVPEASVALHAHQKLYFGRDTSLYRSEPATLRTDAALTVGGVLNQAGTASLPNTCTPGDLVFKTTPPIGYHQCISANTWSMIGAIGAVSWPLLAPDGSETAPSFAFANEPDLGLYRCTPGRMCVSKGGLLLNANAAIDGMYSTGRKTNILLLYTGDDAFYIGPGADSEGGFNGTRLVLRAGTGNSGAGSLILDGTAGQAILNGALYASKFCYSLGVCDFFGAGSPEGVVSASIGSTYRRLDGGPNSTFYVKESGSTETGWVAK